MIVVALVPPALYLGQNIPIATETMVVPTWFRTVAPHLGDHQVLLVLPAAFSGMQPAMTWQATERMPYSMVGGGGPGATFSQYPVQRNGAVIIDKSSFSISIGTPTSDAGIDAVRQALDEWGVTMVVIPDQPDLPAYDQIPAVTTAATLITAATGQRPTYQASAWVWTAVNHSGPAVITSDESFSQCTSGLASRGRFAVDKATTCILASSNAHPSG